MSSIDTTRGAAPAPLPSCTRRRAARPKRTIARPSNARRHPPVQRPTAPAHRTAVARARALPLQVDGFVRRRTRRPDKQRCASARPCAAAAPRDVPTARIAPGSDDNLRTAAPLPRALQEIEYVSERACGGEMGWEEGGTAGGFEDGSGTGP